ncbi:MAG: oxidase [Roseivirga sp.]|nr:oxidase [Roseivirga sp.]
MIDILLDEGFDLQIENQDFNIGESTRQNQGLILMANKGEFKQHPFMGVGLKLYVEDDRLGALRVELTKQLELDGMKVERVNVFSNGKLEIEAGYE